MRSSCFLRSRQRYSLFQSERLRSSLYNSTEHIKQIASRFDETTKRTFRGSEEYCSIPFGSAMDKDPAHDIRSGRLKLKGYGTLDYVVTFTECIMRFQGGGRGPL